MPPTKHCHEPQSELISSAKVQPPKVDAIVICCLPHWEEDAHSIPQKNKKKNKKKRTRPGSLKYQKHLLLYRPNLQLKRKDHLPNNPTIHSTLYGQLDQLKRTSNFIRLELIVHCTRVKKSTVWDQQQQQQHVQLSDYLFAADNCSISKSVFCDTQSTTRKKKFMNPLE